jgi:hypothetical protein
MNTEKFNDVSLNDKVVLEDKKVTFWSILNRFNTLIDSFRSIIFLIQFIFVLFIIISIIIVFNKINNVIKYIEELPNIIKNGVTSIF